MFDAFNDLHKWYTNGKTTKQKSLLFYVIICSCLAELSKRGSDELEWHPSTTATQTLYSSFQHTNSPNIWDGWKTKRAIDITLSRMKQSQLLLKSLSRLADYWDLNLVNTIPLLHILVCHGCIVYVFHVLVHSLTVTGSNGKGPWHLSSIYMGSSDEGHWKHSKMGFGYIAFRRLRTCGNV